MTWSTVWSTIRKAASTVPWWAYVIAALIAALGWKQFQLQAAESLNDELLLDRDALEAAQDSSRELTETLEGVAGQLRIFQRRSLQTEQRNDELEDALGEERIARIEAEAQVDSLVATSTGVVQVDTVRDERSASFRVRREPFTVDADVVLPPPPDSGRIDLGVMVDPVPLGVRLTCGPRQEQGFRSASVLLTTPEWMTAEIGDVSQEPGVCNPQLAEPPDEGFRIPGWVIAPSAGALGGYAVDQDPVDAAMGGLIGIGLDRAVRWVF